MATCDDFDESTRDEDEDWTVLGEHTTLFPGREWTPLAALLRRQIERIRERDFTTNCDILEEDLVDFTSATPTREETRSSDHLTVTEELLSALKQQLRGLIMEFEEVVGKFRERQRALHTRMRQEREERRVKEEELAAQLTDLDQNILVLKDSLPTLSQGDASSISHLRDQVTGAQQSVRRLARTAQQAADAGLELSEGATLRDGIVVLHNSVQKLGQALSELGSVLNTTTPVVASRPVAAPPDKSPVPQTIRQTAGMTDEKNNEEKPTVPTRPPLPARGDTWKVIRDDEDFIPPVRGPSIGALGTLQDADYHVPSSAGTESDVPRHRRSPYESALNRFWAKPEQGREAEETETSLEQASSPSGMESASLNSRRRSLVDVEAWLSNQGSDACYDVCDETGASTGTPSGVSAQYGTPTASTLGTLSNDSASTYTSGRSDVTGGFTPRSTKAKESHSQSPFDDSKQGKNTPESGTPSPVRQHVPVSEQPCEKPVTKRNSMVGLFPCTTLTPLEDRVQQKIRDSHPFFKFPSSDQVKFRVSDDSPATPPGGRVFPAAFATEKRKGHVFDTGVAAPLFQSPDTSWIKQQGRLNRMMRSYLQQASPILRRSLGLSLTVLSLGLLLMFAVLLFLPREVSLELRSALSSYAARSHVFKVKNFGLPPT